MAKISVRQKRYGISEKWGDSVADRGFSQIPNYLILLNQFLDEDAILSPTELLLLIQLVAVWWDAGDKPYPSVATLAKRCGVSDRQVQRAVAALEKKGLLKRVKRRQSGIIASNAYDLEPLVSMLGMVAKAFPNAFPRKLDSSKAIKEVSFDDEIKDELQNGDLF